MSDSSNPVVSAQHESQMPPGFATLHIDARRQLGDWSAPTPRLDALRHDMLGVLSADPTAMWRGHSPVHFTASIVVLDPTSENVALTLHAKAKRWFQFGGHFEDGDANVAAAALREGREESGLPTLRLLPGIVHLDAHDLPGVFGRCRRHLDIRYAAVAEADNLVLSEESDDVRWWPVAALPDGTETTMHEAIALAQDALARDVVRQSR